VLTTLKVLQVAAERDAEVRMLRNLGDTHLSLAPQIIYATLDWLGHFVNLLGVPIPGKPFCSGEVASSKLHRTAPQLLQPAHYHVVCSDAVPACAGHVHFDLSARCGQRHPIALLDLQPEGPGHPRRPEAVQNR